MNKFINVCAAIAIGCAGIAVIGSGISTAEVLGMTCANVDEFVVEENNILKESENIEKVFLGLKAEFLGKSLKCNKHFDMSGFYEKCQTFGSDNDDVFKVWLEVVKEMPAVKPEFNSEPQLYAFENMKGFHLGDHGKILGKNGNVLCVALSDGLTLELCSNDYTKSKEMKGRKSVGDDTIIQLRPIDVVQLFAALAKKGLSIILDIVKMFDTGRDAIVYSGIDQMQKECKEIFGSIAIQSITQDADALEGCDSCELIKLAENVIKYLMHVARHLFFFQTEDDRAASFNKGTKINAKDLVAYIVSLKRAIDDGNLEVLSNDLKVLLFNSGAGSRSQLLSIVKLAFHTEAQMLILSEMLSVGNIWRSVLNPCHSCATLPNVREMASDRKNDRFLYACKDQTFREALKKQCGGGASLANAPVNVYDQTYFEAWRGFDDAVERHKSMLDKALQGEKERKERKKEKKNMKEAGKGVKQTNEDEEYDFSSMFDEK